MTKHTPYNALSLSLLAILACANNNPVTGGARWDDISWLVVAGSNSEWTKV